MNNPYDQGFSYPLPPPMDYNMNNQPPQQVSLSSLVNLSPDSTMSRYGPLPPQEVISTILQAERIPFGQLQRVALFAKAFEGFNSYNRSRIFSIRNSHNKNVIVPSLQNEDSECNTLHVSYWYENDIYSEYSTWQSRKFLNHVNSFEGKSRSSCDHCIYQYTQPCRFLLLFCTLALTLFAIWGLSKGIDSIGLFISSIMAGSIAFTGLIYIPIDICVVAVENNALPEVSEIQSEIEKHYENTIKTFNQIIPQSFPDEKTKDLHSFSKFLIRHLFIPAQQELSFALSDEGVLKNISNIPKELFEDFLMIYRFIRYRALSSPSSIPEMDNITQRMSVSIVYGILDGNQQLNSYLISLFNIKSPPGWNQTPADQLTSLNINNIGGSELREKINYLMKQIYISLNNNNNIPKHSEYSNRISLIKKTFNL